MISGITFIVLFQSGEAFTVERNTHTHTHTHTHTFASLLQQSLKQNNRASHNCCSVKNMSKLLVFKWLLNKLLLEIERSEAMLIWWFVPIKFIRSFLKPFFSDIYWNHSLCNFNFTEKNCPYSIYRYHRFAFFLFFSSESYHPLFCFYPFC